MCPPAALVCLIHLPWHNHSYPCTTGKYQPTSQATRCVVPIPPLAVPMRPHTLSPQPCLSPWWPSCIHSPARQACTALSFRSPRRLPRALARSFLSRACRPQDLHTSCHPSSLAPASVHTRHEAQAHVGSCPTWSLSSCSGPSYADSWSPGRLVAAWRADWVLSAFATLHSSPRHMPAPRARGCLLWSQLPTSSRATTASSHPIPP